MNAGIKKENTKKSLSLFLSLSLVYCFAFTGQMSISHANNYLTTIYLPRDATELYQY